MWRWGRLRRPGVVNKDGIEGRVGRTVLCLLKGSTLLSFLSSTCDAIPISRSILAVSGVSIVFSGAFSGMPVFMTCSKDQYWLGLESLSVVYLVYEVQDVPETCIEIMLCELATVQCESYLFATS